MNRARRNGAAGILAVSALGLLFAGPAQAREQVPCGDVPALRAAIRQANATDGTVVLAPGCAYRLTTPDSGEDGLPPITGDVRISSANAVLTRISGPPFRILHVTGGGTLTLERTTISGGLASGGGALLSEGGTVTLVDVTVEKSRATGQGGGIDNATGTLTMRGGFLRANVSANNGGGVENRAAGATTLIGVSITGNTGGGWGGGVGNDGNSALSLVSSTVSGNRAARGGGLSTTGSAVTVLSSRITDNVAATQQGGGGIYGPGGRIELFWAGITGNAPDNCAPAGGIAGCAN
ncbi:right-handed parallel beta-helix repeat-containing protein [Actinocorallia longicatena]|uniref:Outer membrane repeat protein n=1 Tax=Actinocorallia longicatena TaxID=111803 RepID=A0ABP6QH02_9ACTN